MELREELRQLAPFCALTFITGTATAISAYWVIYFNQIGLSFTQISFMLALASIAPMIFEVPTGAVADALGRKISVTAGFFLVGIATIAVAFSDSFYYLAGILFFSAAANTLQTGAFDAWIVDYAKSLKRTTVHSALSKTRSFAFAGAFISLVASSFITAQYGIKMLWIFSGAAMAVAGVYGYLFCPENFSRRQIHVSMLRHSISASVKGAKYALTHRVLKYILAVTVITAFFGVWQIAWQPLFVEVGVPLPHIGIIFAALMLVAIAFSALSPRFKALFGTDRRALIAGEIISGILFASVLFVSSSLQSAALFLLLGAIGSMTNPIYESYFHKFVPSPQRATISSFKSWLSNGAGIIAVLAGGLAMDTIGPRMTMAALSVLVIPTILLYLRIDDGRGSR
ncbi:MAG: MFS transporter [Candidatus Aenigmarchaeota archaeon]|nr:MFS transporter [Candidatus Aenigmarchaeota archaeon]